MKFPFIILILLLNACTDHRQPNKLEPKQLRDSILHDLSLDSISKKEFHFSDLSYTNNYNLILSREWKNGIIFKDYWTVIIFNKKQNILIDSFTQSMISYGSDFQDFNKVRSLITGKNSKMEVIDNDYGDLIIADFNFDLLEDIAIVNDLGGNSGRFYSFYIQKDNKFKIDNYLTDSVVYFPSIQKKQKQLVTHVHAGVCHVGEHIYKIERLKKGWSQISHKLLNICN